MQLSQSRTRADVQSSPNRGVYLNQRDLELVDGLMLD